MASQMKAKTTVQRLVLLLQFTSSSALLLLPYVRDTLFMLGAPFASVTKGKGCVPYDLYVSSFHDQ